MRILITGNMGYVGPVVVRHLRRRFPGAELIGYDTALFAAKLLLHGGLPERHLTRQIFGDVRDIEAQDLTGVDAIVHLAALSNDPMGNRFSAATDAINHAASARLAALAREAEVRAFVFASSCSVYGAGGDAPRRESDPTAPLTAYARSKIATEESLAAMNRGGMVVTCLRFATACGMSDRPRLDLVLNDFVACALSTGKISVLSDGNPWRPLIDVSDMARAIEWAATRPAMPGGQYLVVNVGADAWNYQVKDLAEAVSQEVTGTTVEINREAPPDKRSYRVDFSLWRGLAPDHQPRMTLGGSIGQIAAGLRSAGFADAGFRDGELIRLAVLNRFIESGVLTEDIRWRDDP